MTESEKEDDSCVTLNNLVELVDEEEKLIDDADAVLGGSDDKNCTYLMGYVNRQALYSCLTCKGLSTGKLPSGVCLACSLTCHDGHDLVELYTKRNFRCDCGNSKFPTDFLCKLHSEKVPLNQDNKYNHNFDGLYCTCSRPYPDPDDSIDDDMIQCVICEDWFHKRHLTASLKLETDDYEEMVCVACVQHCLFLWSYVKLCNAFFVEEQPETVSFVPDNTTNKCETQESNIDVITDTKISNEESTQSSSGYHLDNTDAKLLDDSRKDSNTNSSTFKPNDNAISQHNASCSSQIDCRLHELDQCTTQSKQSPIFWPSKWRKQLCTCINCKDLYDIKGVSYLLSEGDCITEYEEKGKLNGIKHKMDEHMSNMNHIQKVELIDGYMNLKTGLIEYLKKFAENGKVVRQEDINEFFTDLHARKRKKNR